MNVSYKNDYRSKKQINGSNETNNQMNIITKILSLLLATNLYYLIADCQALCP